LSGGIGTDWRVIDNGDYNGDGRADILWQHSSGTFGEWYTTDTGFVGGASGAYSTVWHLI